MKAGVINLMVVEWFKALMCKSYLFSKEAEDILDQPFEQTIYYFWSAASSGYNQRYFCCLHNNSIFCSHSDITTRKNIFTKIPPKDLFVHLHWQYLLAFLPCLSIFPFHFLVFLLVQDRLSCLLNSEWEIKLFKNF